MNKIERILEQVLMKHHDDISKEDDDAIAQAQQDIYEAVKKVIEELKRPQIAETFNGCDLYIRIEQNNKTLTDTQENLKRLFEEE